MSYHEGSNWQAKKEDEGKPLYDKSAIESKSLPPSDIKSIEQEAAEKYPHQIPQREIILSFAEVVDMKRAAHISCAKQYIERIKELEEINRRLIIERDSVIDELQLYRLEK